MAATAVRFGSIQLLENLIRTVENAPTFRAGITSVAKDVAWRPTVPRGHTPYSWGSDEQEAPCVASTAVPAAAAAPAAAEKAPEAKAQPQQQPQQQAGKGKGGQQQQQKAAEKKNAPAPQDPIAAFARLDIRVGKILKAWKHPEADSLYVEEIDVGEEKPRQIVSGLVKFIPLEQMQGANVLVLANLKPSPLRKITSYGMVLCASNADHTKVEFVVPPEGSKPGERVTLEGLTLEEPDVNVDGKKDNTVWAVVKPVLKTDGNCVATCADKPLITSKGVCKAASLTNANIS